MKIQKFDELWKWLKITLKKFEPRYNSYVNVVNCVKRQYNNYENETDLKLIGFMSAINLYQNHYLINDNKRIAFDVQMIIQNENWEEIKHLMYELEME